MSEALRHSPLHGAFTALGPTWGTINGMRVPLAIAGETDDMSVRLADASCLTRVGVKGPEAERWLVSQGVEIPQGVNTWVRSSEGVMIARLARSEFLLEDRIGGARVQQLAEVLAPGPGVYPVLRQDAALVVAGLRIDELLTQVCNVDFRALPLERQAVVMTSMVGVSVTVIWHKQKAAPCYRIWCDGTFGPYLWETLLGIAREMGGGACGLQSVFPEAVTQ